MHLKPVVSVKFLLIIKKTISPNYTYEIFSGFFSTLTPVGSSWAVSLMCSFSAPQNDR